MSTLGISIDCGASLHCGGATFRNACLFLALQKGIEDVRECRVPDEQVAALVRSVRGPPCNSQLVSPFADGATSVDDVAKCIEPRLLAFLRSWRVGLDLFVVVGQEPDGVQRGNLVCVVDAVPGLPRVAIAWHRDHYTHFAISAEPSRERSPDTRFDADLAAQLVFELHVEVQRQARDEAFARLLADQLLQEDVDRFLQEDVDEAFARQLQLIEA